MTQYFVSNYYQPAGRPWMEDRLMEIAKTMYFHCLVVKPAQMVDALQKQQDLLHDQNKRAKQVKISLCGMLSTDGVLWLTIGSSHLVLQEVRENGGIEALV